MANLEKLVDNCIEEKLPPGGFGSDMILEAQCKNTMDEYYSQEIFVDKVKGFVKRKYDLDNFTFNNKEFLAHIKGNFLKLARGRYEINFNSDFALGKGAYGLVLNAYDNKTNKEVAIKILHNANKELQNITGANSDNQFSTDAELVSCDNVIPTYVVDEGELGKDENAFSFIVMKKHNTFLSDIFKKKENKLYLDDEIVPYMDKIVNGITNFQKYYDRFYGDLKLDNIAVNSIDDIALADKGFASYDSKSERNQYMNKFVKSPKLFSENYNNLLAKVDKEESKEMLKKHDQNAIANNFYKMLTGKYLFEDEFNNQCNGNHDKFEELMSGFVDKEGKFNDAYKIELKKKLKVVPKKWRKFVENGFLEQYSDMNKLKDNFHEIKNGFNFEEAKKPWYKRYADALVTAGVITFCGGILLAGVISKNNYLDKMKNLDLKFNETMSKLENAKAKFSSPNEVHAQVGQYLAKYDSLPDLDTRKYEFKEMAQDLIVLDALRHRVRFGAPDYKENVYDFEYVLNDSTLNFYRNNFPNAFGEIFNLELENYKNNIEEEFGRSIIDYGPNATNPKRALDIYKADKVLEEFFPIMDTAITQKYLDK